MADPSIAISNLIQKYKTSPLLPLELSLVIKRLNDDNASVLDFKNQYYRDPLLCAYLIDLAWHRTKNKTNHPVAADHAMSTVGIDGARDYLANLSLKLTSCENEQQDVNDNLSDEIKFVMSSSLLAASIAENCCNNSSKGHQLYWASMAHQFPDLLMWHLKPKAMWRIQYRQIKLAKKLPLFEQAKLGFELNQWRQSIANEWHMSELNQITYTKTPIENRKELLEYMHHGFSKKTPSIKSWQLTDSWLILTSNWLAKAIMAPWLCNSYSHYHRIAQQAFCLNDNKMSHAVIKAIRETSHHLKGSALFVPASCYLNLRGNFSYPVWLNAAPKIPVKREQKYIEKAKELKKSSEELMKLKESSIKVKKTIDKINSPISSPINKPAQKVKYPEIEIKKQSVKTNKSAVEIKPLLKDVKTPSAEKKQATSHLAIKKLLRKIKENTNKFSNASELLREVIEFCVQDFGFNRVNLLTVDWQSKQVSTNLFFKQNENQKINIRFNISDNTPFNQFLTKQGFLTFDIKKHQKIWHKLPREIIQQQVKSFILFSIKPKTFNETKKINQLIYLDCLGQQEIPEDKIKLVKILLQTANQALLIQKKL